MNFQLLDGEKFIILRVLKVDHRGSLRFRLTVRLFHRDGDAVPEEKVLFLVDLQEGRRGKAAFQRFLRLGKLRIRHPRVEPPQSILKIPGQQYLVIACPPERAVFAEHFRIVSELHIPAELIPEQIPGAFLHEDVFRIVVAHGVTSKLFQVLLSKNTFF